MERIIYILMAVYSVKLVATEIRSFQEERVQKQVLLLYRFRMYWKCKEQANQTPSGAEEGDLFCPANFDGWSCWEATRAGHRTSTPCFPSQLQKPGNATRLCTWRGEWENDQNGDHLINYESCFKGQKEDLYAIYDFDKTMQSLTSLERSPYENEKLAEIYEDCIITLLLRDSYLPKGYCPGTFDGWSCWNDTPAGETAYVSCPTFVLGFKADRYAYKMCESDGTWYRHPLTNKSWSNYTTCVDHEDLMFRRKIINLSIAGYSISLIALLVSLAIFFYFQSLKCTRITIHKNLFISFIMNDIMWIIWYNEVVQHPDVVMINSVGCQILHVLVQYFLLCNYFWMFCEGLHLHTLMVFAFVQEEKVLRGFFVIGWALPLILIAIYAFVRLSTPSENIHCWIEESPLQWIINGPACLSLLLNFIFLVNIVRVLVTKLRAVNSPEAYQTKKAVRATLILLPLLGLHYLVTPFRPEPGTAGEAVYETISTIVASFQGLCVALLFCFFNGEVVALWKKKWMRFKLSRANGLGVSYAATSLSYRNVLDEGK